MIEARINVNGAPLRGFSEAGKRKVDCSSCGVTCDKFEQDFLYLQKKMVDCYGRF